MDLVVILTIRRNALEGFEAYENHAVGVMARHGGAIRQAVRIPPEPDAKTVREVHVVSFPDEAAFHAYREDPELREAAPLREATIVKTEIWVGEPAPVYRSPAA